MGFLRGDSMRFKIVFSKNVKQWNKKHMKKRFIEIEGLRFFTRNEAENFILQTIGSGSMEYFVIKAVVEREVKA